MTADKCRQRPPAFAPCTRVVRPERARVETLETRGKSNLMGETFVPRWNGTSILNRCLRPMQPAELLLENHSKAVRGCLSVIIIMFFTNLSSLIAVTLHATRPNHHTDKVLATTYHAWAVPTIRLRHPPLMGPHASPGSISIRWPAIP